MPASRPRTLPIFLAAAFMFAALAARFFVLPLRVHDLGGDKIAVGLLATAFTASGAVLSLPAGFLADRFGTRPLMLFALLAGGISQLGVALAPSVPPMFFWQALGGLCGGAAQAAMLSALADAVPSERLGRSIGWLTLAFQFGFLAGPAGAGILAQWLSLQGVLLCSTALFALSLALSLLMPAKPGAEVGWNLVAPLREISRRRGFLAGCVGMLGATLVWGTLQAYLPLFGKEQLRLPETQIGYMIAIQALANGLARIPGGRLVDRVAKRGPLVIVGLAGFSTALAILPHLDGFWPAAALLAASVPLLATTYLALGVVFANLATRETRGVAMGFYGLMLFAGLGLGPAIFGPVLERGGYVVGFTACAISGVVLAGAVAVLRADRFSRQPVPRPYLP